MLGLDSDKQNQSHDLFKILFISFYHYMYQYGMSEYQHINILWQKKHMYLIKYVIGTSSAQKPQKWLTVR